jgi:hypothetical protein
VVIKNYIKTLFYASVFLLGACSSGFSNVAPDVRHSAEQLTETLKGTSFTAVVGLHVHGYHYVDGNGKPLSDKNQSQRLASKGMFTKTYAVAKGEVGHGLVILMKDNSKLQVVLSKEGGLSGAWNPSNVIIDYGRPITAKDLTPQAFAYALSSLIIIKGYEPGSEFDDILKQLK